MQIVVLFGLPGAGKTFAGNVLKKYFNFYHHDGDIDLPDNMKRAIRTQTVITDSLRDIFFQKIIQSTKRLKAKYENIVVTQTFIKEKYRKLFFREFPKARFILIQTAAALREIRLLQRKNYPLNLEYVRKMCRNFDPPQIKHSVINNASAGDKSIKKQIQLILDKSSTFFPRIIQLRGKRNTVNSRSKLRGFQKVLDI